MSFPALTRHLIWTVLLFYSPSFLLSTHIHLIHLVGEIVFVMLYTVFLAYVLVEKSKTQLPARRLCRWLSNKDNIKKMTGEVLTTVKNTLYCTCLPFGLAFVVAMPFSSLSYWDYINWTRVWFGGVWCYALIMQVFTLHRRYSKNRHTPSAK
ncbi:hypothetical protein ACPV5U_28105 [Vibrio mediterranei]